MSVVEPLIAMRAITKSFADVRANIEVDLDIRRGEVLAVLGENGAGKSTLLKILYGFYRLDSGSITYDGEPVEISSPNVARKMGIGMVFQDFTLIPAMTALENAALFLNDAHPLLRRPAVLERMADIATRFALEVDPMAPIAELSVGEQQKVEIIKLLLADARVLILDEPTKVLAPHEVDGLFRVFGQLQQEGYSIVFVTHKLKEVMQCSSRITVMRRGRVSGQLESSAADEASLIEMMLDESLATRGKPARVSAEAQQSLFELRGATTNGRGKSVSLRNLELEVRHGEIVGVAGVSGNGQRELGDLIVGLDRCYEGSIRFKGEDSTAWSPAKLRKEGVAFIPEDPYMAAVAGLSVEENMVLGHLSRYSRHRGLSVAWDAARRDLETTFELLEVQSPKPEIKVGKLSGGNVQRIVVAREIAHKVTLVLAFYPTRGLDVPSANAVRSRLVACRDSAAGVLLISEDLDELFDLSDRLVVMNSGRIVGRMRPEETSAMEIGHLMTGSEDG